jgi:hypothetical protein
MPAAIIGQTVNGNKDPIVVERGDAGRLRVGEHSWPLGTPLFATPQKRQTSAVPDGSPLEAGPLAKLKPRWSPRQGTEIAIKTGE